MEKTKKADKALSENIKTEHKIKVIRQSSYGYQPTPTIILKGKWLEHFGFGIETPITVTCRDGELIITKRVSERSSNTMDVPGADGM